MGSVFGKIVVECPKFELLKQMDGYEVRKYPELVEVATEYASDKSSDAFRRLAAYIGVFRSPENQIAGAAEKVDMTAPVVSEKVAMTAPVVSQAVQGSSQGSSPGMMRMAFLLPSKYTAENAPSPTNPMVSLHPLPARIVAVSKFSGSYNETNVEPKVHELRKRLDADGIKPVGEGWMLFRYNDPFTIPYFRTNEVAIEVNPPSS